MLALLLALIQLPADAPAAEKKAAALVAQLGDPAFRKREAAARDLLALGAPAKAAIEAGLKDPDIEIRDRCKKLLPAVWEASLSDRLDRAVRDAQCRLPHDLPGWDRLAKRANSEIMGRYAKILANQREAIRYLECQPADLITAYEARLAESNNLAPEHVAQLRRGATITLAFDTDELAFWLLVLSDPRVVQNRPPQVPDRDAFVKNLIHAADSQRHWKGANAPFLEAVLVSVMDSFVSQEASADIVALGFGIAENRELPGMATVAADWISRKHPSAKLIDRAIGIIGMSRRPEHLKVLAGLLNDNSPLAADYFRDYTTLKRDFALAMSLRIEGQSPREYGFATDSQQQVPRAYSFGFKSEADRSRAFERYAEFLRK